MFQKLLLATGIACALQVCACSGSILVMKMRPLQEALKCGRGEKMHVVEIASSVQDVPPRYAQFHRAYRAWCSGRVVLLECQADMLDTGPYVRPTIAFFEDVELPRAVSWHCWVDQDRPDPYDR